MEGGREGGRDREYTHIKATVRPSCTFMVVLVYVCMCSNGTTPCFLQSGSPSVPAGTWSRCLISAGGAAASCSAGTPSCESAHQPVGVQMHTQPLGRCSG